MKEQQESKPKKPNILVRLIALLVTAALLLGALVLVVYRDRLNLDALARWFEYRNLETSESGEAVPFSHAGGRQANFAYLDSGVLLASDTGARYYSFSGELYAEEVRNLEQPVLTHSSGYGVVYDAGGQDLFLFSGVEEAFHLTLDSGELLPRRGLARPGHGVRQLLQHGRAPHPDPAVHHLCCGRRRLPRLQDGGRRHHGAGGRRFPEPDPFLSGGLPGALRGDLPGQHGGAGPGL